MMAPVVSISVQSRARRVNRRWKTRQCRSVQSIMGAMLNRRSNMLFSFISAVKVCPLLGPTNDRGDRIKAFSFLFNGLIRSFDDFQLFSPCSVLHGSTKMPAQYRASIKCFGCAQLRQLAEFEMGTVLP